MINKTFLTIAVLAGLAGTGAIAGPNKARHDTASARERAETRQLNQQQLASAGSYTAQPGASQWSNTANGGSTAPVPVQSPDPSMQPAPMTEAPATPPQ